MQPRQATWLHSHTLQKTKFISSPSLEARRTLTAQTRKDENADIKFSEQLALLGRVMCGCTQVSEKVLWGDADRS